MKYITNLIGEDSGRPSWSRMFSSIITACIVVDWMHAVFTVGKWSPDIEVIALALGAITAKVVQKPFEKKGVDK